MVKRFNPCLDCGRESCICREPEAPRATGHRHPYMLLLIYASAFVLTFGAEGARYTSEGDPYARNTAFFAALFWPAYWPMRLSWDYFERARR